MKRFFLLAVLNVAVLMMLSLASSVLFAVLGVPLAKIFGDYSYLACFSIALGFGGSIISLLISKPMAKWSVHARTITGNEGPAERWLVDTVADLAQRAGLKTPEVAIYEGSANAFATGAFKNSALVAVSTDIMRQMTKDELRAVLGHEISHVANGDMVTMCLAQGVLNVFVIFLSRVLASVIDGALSGNRSSRNRSSGFAYYIVVPVLELLFGLLASVITCWYSRRREFAADSGSARLLGSPASMIAALRRLGNLQPGVLPASLRAFGIASKPKTSLWATHPPLQLRIDALLNAGPR